MILLVFHYFRWHYSYAFSDFLGIIRNFLWFFYEFFSISLSLQTLFTPFHRLKEDRKQANSLDISVMAEALIVNFLMRFVGMLLRTFIIGIGVFFLLLTIILGAVFIFVWAIAPLLLFFLVGSGITFLAA